MKFGQGKQAYARGQYQASVVLLEQARFCVPPRLLLSVRAPILPTPLPFCTYLDIRIASLGQALNEEGPFSLVGGEIQLWLALAYQACGREDDCLETYKMLEKTHPIPAIRRQACAARHGRPGPDTVSALPHAAPPRSRPLLMSAPAPAPAPTS